MMEKEYTAEASQVIHAPRSKVWQALTDPSMISKYLFGSEVTTDWKVGSPVTYKGMWQGKPFEDKGKVVQVEPEKLLVLTHWSPLSGVPDAPANYHTVRYELGQANGGTRVRITQDNNASEEEMQHSKKNWTTVLDNMKKLLEE